MTMSFKLEMTCNGEAVKGYSSVVSHGREDSIEGLEFSTEIITAREKGSGLATGRREHKAARIVKRVDKASPILARAITNNELVTATLSFYQPSRDGDGTTVHFYTVELTEGRIAGLNQISSNAIDPATANLAMMEELFIVYGVIRWSEEIDSVEHIDDWKNDGRE